MKRTLQTQKQFLLRATFVLAKTALLPVIAPFAAMSLLFRPIETKGTKHPFL